MRGWRFELEVGCSSCVSFEHAEGVKWNIAVFEGTMTETVRWWRSGVVLGVGLRGWRFELEVGCSSCVCFEHAEGVKWNIAVFEGTMTETVRYSVSCGRSIDVVLAACYMGMVGGC